MFRNSIVILLLVHAVNQVDAQSAAMVPVRRAAPSSKTLSQLLGSSPTSGLIQTSVVSDTTSAATDQKNFGVETVNAQTLWAFQLRDDSALSSPVVRLGDIVEPLNPNLGAWPRLKRVSVGLLPTDGTPMVIERDRLTHTITTIEATPRQVDWYGRSEIRIHYDPSLSNVAQLVVQASTLSEPPVTVAQHSRKQPISNSLGIVQASFATNTTEAGQFDELSEPVVLDPITRDRIRHWIELAIRREMRELGEEYEVTVDDRDAVIAPLAVASSLASIELAEAAHEGEVVLTVIGRHREGPIVVAVPIHLIAHPKVVVANANLQRGERIGISDVRLAPLPKKQWRDAYATSIESIIGQEVRGIVREGTPISSNEIGLPILVHRGDLLEVRVVGGAVTITTNAKSIGEGALADLIEVETIQPRRRLIAKVVSPGLVEILTRAPMVK